MRAAEQYREFQRVEVLREFGEVELECLLVFDLLGLRLALGQLNHDAEVVELLFSGDQGLDFPAQRPGLVNQLLSLIAAVPEGLFGHLGVEIAEAFLHPRDVKETSASGQVSHRRRPTGL